MPTTYTDLIANVRRETKERLTVVPLHGDRLAAVVDELKPVVAAEHSGDDTEHGGPQAVDGRDVADTSTDRPVRSRYGNEHEHGNEPDAGGDERRHPSQRGGESGESRRHGRQCAGNGAARTRP